MVADGRAFLLKLINVTDYFYHKEHLFIVCELLKDNLYEFYKFNFESGDEIYFTLPRLKKVTRQILTALNFVHDLNSMYIGAAVNTSHSSVHCDQRRIPPVLA